MDETPLELLKVISLSRFTFDVLDASAICFGQWDGNLVKLEMMSGKGIFLGCLERERKGKEGGEGERVSLSRGIAARCSSGWITIISFFFSFSEGILHLTIVETFVILKKEMTCL